MSLAHIDPYLERQNVTQVTPKRGIYYSRRPIISQCFSYGIICSVHRLWFIEYTIIGVICGMFVIGTSLLVVGHCSSEPTSRHAFNSSRKNACARALNIFVSSHFSETHSCDEKYCNI